MPDYEVLGLGSVPGTVRVRGASGRELDIPEDLAPQVPHGAMLAEGGPMGVAGVMDAPPVTPTAESIQQVPEDIVARRQALKAERTNLANQNVQRALVAGDPVAQEVAQQPPQMSMQEVAQRALGAQQVIDALQPVRPGGGGPRVKSQQTTAFEQYAPQTPEQARALMAMQSAAGRYDADAERLQRQGIDLATTAESEAFEREAQEVTAARQAQEQARVEFEKAQLLRQEELDRKSDAIAQKLEDVAEARIEPKQIWSRENAGQAAAFSIAGILSIAGDALTGGAQQYGNIVAQQINKVIDDDMDRQREALARKERGAIRESGIIADLQSELGDREAAFLASRALKLEDLESRVRSIRALAQSDLKRANADITLAEIQRQKAEAIRGAIERSIPKMSTETTVTRASGGGGGKRATLHPELQKKIIERAFPEDEEAAKSDTTYSQRLAVAKEEAKLARLNKTIAPLEKYIAEGGDIPGVGPIEGRVLSIYKDTPIGMLFPPKQHNEMQQAIDSSFAIALYGTAGKQLSDEERKFMQVATGLSIRSTPGQIARGIKVLRDIAQSERDAIRAAASPRARRELDAGMATETGVSSPGAFSSAPEVE